MKKSDISVNDNVTSGAHWHLQFTRFETLDDSCPQEMSWVEYSEIKCRNQIQTQVTFKEPNCTSYIFLTTFKEKKQNKTTTGQDR